MRLVTWNCSGALHRKFDALLRLRPDIAIVCECAQPERLRARGCDGNPIWIGQNPNRGLAVFGFNGYAARLAEPFHATLRYVAPIRITGPEQCNLLAVWAQNGSGGVSRKHQLGPLRRALIKYKALLSEGPCIVAGDLNNNVIWHRPGWRINHVSVVSTLGTHGLTSVYHALRGEAQGEETVPTLYWRDRKKDGPTYHIDYVFLPAQWIGRVAEFSVGTYEDWCGSGLSDHVPLLVDIVI
jgi:hypothetical protein